jgi:Ser/Thr protein kinase RdoA (MazF antagonist)
LSDAGERRVLRGYVATVDSTWHTSGWVRSVPSVAAVSHLVEDEYGVPVTQAVLVRSFNNDVYRVHAGERSYALKIYGVSRWTQDEVRWEQQLVRHLTNSGMPVAAAVALRDGDTVGVLDAPEGIRPFAMAEWVPGAKPQAPYTDSLYRHIGETLARLHAAADSFRSSYPRRTLRTGAEVHEVSDVLDPGSSLQRLVQRTGAEAQVQLTHLSEHGLRWGIRHGDPTLDNLHASDSGLYFYDFDLAGPGWQVGDLTGALSTEFADAFLTGYTAVRRLPPIELEALPWLRIMEIIENLHFHLIGKPAMQGTASLAEGWVERGFESLAASARQLRLTI